MSIFSERKIGLLSKMIEMSFTFYLYLKTYDQATDEYYLHTFTEQQPDLNWENPQVRQEIYKMMRWWLDKGVDGFRMDVINFISKVPGYPENPIASDTQYTNGSQYFINGPCVHEYLKEMNDQVLQHYNIVTVGECPGE